MLARVVEAQTIISDSFESIAICGDGVREVKEECDDGNLLNLDGCNSNCRFEQNQRINWLEMQFETDASCTNNQLGSAFVGAAIRDFVQQGLADGVSDGSIDVLLPMLDLDDPSGNSDGALQVGILSGTPETLGGLLEYDGTADVDWWHLPDPTQLDPDRLPLIPLNASISALDFTAGPGRFSMDFAFGPSLASLAFSDAVLDVATHTVTEPLVSIGGEPPGHLPAENLDPNLQSFELMGDQTGSGSGNLSGDVNARSLSLVPVPDALLTGITACSQGYSAANSLLDVLVSGCTAFAIPQIAPRQPDAQDDEVPPAGAGAPYTLTVDAITKAVNGCQDTNGLPVDLEACLDAAAYSSCFDFTTNRVIIRWADE